MAAVNRRGKIVALSTVAVGVVVLAAGTVAQQLADRDPRIADHQSKKEFFIQIVKPDPKIDYKIVQIQPDPRRRKCMTERNQAVNGYGEDHHAPDRFPTRLAHRKPPSRDAQ
jgi:hypothetical protein